MEEKKEKNALKAIGVFLMKEAKLRMWHILAIFIIGAIVGTWL